MLRTENHDRVRVLTIDRPDALNALDEEHYDALAVALDEAGDDDGVSVVVLTGAGRAFCAGTDLKELRARTIDPDGFAYGDHGFAGFADRLAGFPKPLIVAINGIGVGIGVTVIGYADLVLISTEARLRAPFTHLGVAPEAGSTVLFPRLVGHQRAFWTLLSSEWLDADAVVESGLALEACPPDDLMPTALDRAATLAAQSLPSLMAGKALLMDPIRAAVAEARRAEDRAFARLLAGDESVEALRSFTDRSS